MDRDTRGKAVGLLQVGQADDGWVVSEGRGGGFIVAEALGESLEVGDAVVVDAASPISVDDPSNIKGKKVLVVEDGPTLTHGGMKLGAGTLAA